ncbi:hypothetical protein KTR66_04675 [Roseococcus sp. SDR]|uniref:hypothetical protein n=1 Tax=Roseococcus sp. SDR TaxID=2835532 RepID=UPI001BCFCBE6|nr:hypothetical protein [Roseococcus sp. SDR]MBS7789274.1 hypothetical protein [Roseococcus sp. SDR]MBV1844588.1 hypothetical protein [Roseococcus sp. SDR]
MATKTPAPWIDRARLRLALPGHLVALHDDKGVIPPERYLRSEEGGYIALLAEPEGEVMVEVAEPAPAKPSLPPKPVDAP